MVPAPFPWVAFVLLASEGLKALVLTVGNSSPSHSLMRSMKDLNSCSIVSLSTWVMLVAPASGVVLPMTELRMPVLSPPDARSALGRTEDPT